AFSLSKEGVVLLPCSITAQSPYTKKEWAKIENFAAEEGASFSNVEAAKNHLNAL
ncbi:MAG: hypothetical protein HQL23_01805, partial [Candidatus Omnitrophica bacterium]|nr:hypothetical protein [Candidatus Omnitrophota bacterium]